MTPAYDGPILATGRNIGDAADTLYCRNGGELRGRSGGQKHRFAAGMATLAVAAMSAGLETMHQEVHVHKYVLPRHRCAEEASCLALQ